MAKDIPAKEFKAAVTAMNAQLKEDGAKTIKVVAVKKPAIFKEFVATVKRYIKDDKASSLPDTVIDFYNTHVATEDAPEGKNATKKKKAAASKKKAAKKSGKKDTKKAPPKEKAPSNEQRAYDWVKAGKTDKFIAAQFKKMYERKGMKDEKFIAKRAAIYTGIAKRKLKKEEGK